MPGHVIRLPKISREMLREKPETMFVFGDNMEGRGMGGQAGAMRGEPNAIGVPTKWRPARRDVDYFSDADIKNRDVWHAIHEAFERTRAALQNGQDVVIPTDGLGTGLAELPIRAPKIHAAIEAAIAGLSGVADPH